MGKKKVIYVSIFGGIGLLGLIALTVAILTQRNKEIVPLSADEVGITRIFNEKIVSVKFDDLNPNFIGDCEDVTMINPLLDIAAKAVYQPTKKKYRRLSALDMIYIETTEHSYGMGYVNNSVFEFSVDGDSKYYKCDDKDVFLYKLFEIQKQWALTRQKK